MRTTMRILVPALALALACGCRGYEWKPKVDREMRTVSVPTFRNESKVTGLGDVVTRQVLREIQREGTFRIAPRDDAAVEIQAVVTADEPRGVAYDRRTGLRDREYRLAASAKVSFIDRRTGRILADGRRYSAETTFLAHDDLSTGSRDASGRLGEDLARQIVDDLTAWNWADERKGHRK